MVFAVDYCEKVRFTDAVLALKSILMAGVSGSRSSTCARTCAPRQSCSSQALPAATTSLVIVVTKIDRKAAIEAAGEPYVGAADMLELLEMGQAWAAPAPEKMPRRVSMHRSLQQATAVVFNDFVQFTVAANTAVTNSTSLFCMYVCICMRAV